MITEESDSKEQAVGIEEKKKNTRIIANTV